MNRQPPVLKLPRAVCLLSALLAVGLATAAWACTVQARIVTLAPSAGSVGTKVTVRGEGLPAGTPIEARWNDQRGAVLASGVADAAGAFSAQIDIPQTAPGVYSIVAMAQDFGLARTAFEVFPAGSAGPSESGQAAATTVAPDLWTGFAQGDSGLAPAPDATALRSSDNALRIGFFLTAVGGGALSSIFVARAARRTRGRKPAGS